MTDLDSIFLEDWPDDHRSGFVAIVGRPNVGKSTLINQVLQQKIAIVTPTPQTTRRNQLGIYTTEQAQVVFVDTPGIHNPHHKLGEFMVNVAESSLRDADLVLWVVDISANPTQEEQDIANRLERLRETPVLIVLNKLDLVQADLVESLTQTYQQMVPQAMSHVISARDGDGVEGLMEQILSHMPLGPRYYPKEQVSDQNLRFIAAEVVREKVILNTRQEIPHAVAVGIDTFEEKPNGKTYEIHATIYVEQESQKGIIIGSKGSMIKQLGIEARAELEKVFDRDVNLFLHVKTQKNWRSDDRQMRRFGYYVPKDD